MEELKIDVPEGISPEEARAWLAKQAGMRAAAAAPLPGPLRGAFAEPARVVCGFTLLPVVAAHVALLQQIESPLIQVARAMFELRDEPEEVLRKAMGELSLKRAGETDGEAEARLQMETAETFFVFTRKPAEVRALLRQGREVFREAAVAEVMDRLAPAEFAEVQRAIGEHFASGFATAVQYEAERPDDGTFRSPPATSQTGSAGG